MTLAAGAPNLAQAEALVLAAELPPLLAEAERLAASFSIGEHGRKRSGDGADFWQYRRSQPGDPASSIDWRQSARSEHLYVRETEWTASQPVWLWVDGSGSMGWHSSPSLESKHHRALLLALTMAALLLKSGERVGVLGADEPPAQGRALLARIGQSLISSCGAVPPERQLAQGGHLLMISDFLPPNDDRSTRIRRWAEAGVKGHLLQVLDPAEEDFTFQGRLRLEGLEGEAPLPLDKAEELRDTYARRLAELRRSLHNATHPLGWSFETHLTAQPARDGAWALHRRLAGASRV